MTVKQIVATLLRGAKGANKEVTREAVVNLIQQASAKQQGIRRGWQVKAAVWVKKVHVDRGDVKVGKMAGGRFTVLPELRPRYLVPDDLDTFELKPYVAIEAQKKEEPAAAAAAGQGGAQ